ncbi:MAG: LysR family transcriptional regulator [Acidimicrobiales bacterium]
MPLAQPLPDVASLDLLRSVAELGSIGRAAAAHRISQPAASMRLRSLERSLGLTLLDRSRGPARLNDHGQAVVEWSQRVIEAMEDLIAGASAIRSAGRGQLRLGASMTVAEYLLPVWLQRLRVTAPNLSVSLQMGNSEQVAAVTSRGAVDLGFVEGRTDPTGLRSCQVATDQLVVLVAPAHSWARRPAGVTPGELARTPLVLREPGSGTREVLESAMAQWGLSPTALVELGSTTAIKAAVTESTGPAVLSRLAVAEEVRQGRLVVVEVAGLRLTRLIRAVWRRDGELPAGARQLLSLAAEDAR